MEDKSFIEHIEKQRQALHFSQLELCRAAGIDPSTYTKLLTLDRIPQGRTRRKLMNAIKQLEEVAA
jgi:transcriptional regulator with XRE-family HTH domain